jgi:hypothetical protein
LLLCEPQSCLTPKFANAYYQFAISGSNTPAPVYTNATLTAQFSPTGKVTADSYGRFAPIYLDPSVAYRVTLYNSSNVQQWQVDPYETALPTVGKADPYGFTIAPTGEVTTSGPNSGGTGISLTVKAGAIGTAALCLNGTLAGNSVLIINNSATTGTQTATFAATNKPGTVASSPAGWLPITCDGVQYYTPIWHGNTFSPYTSNPSANGEVIGASSVTFGGNGLTTATRGSAVPGNWFSPTTAGIGAGYYINITRTGGTTGVNFTAAQGAWTNITSGGLTVATSGYGSITGTYQISSSVSGSPIVASGTINLISAVILDLYTYGSGTETIPSGGYSTVTIELYSGVPGGGGASVNSGAGGGSGGGGAGPSYVRSVYSVSGSAGFTMLYNVGSGGAGGGGVFNGTASAGGSSTASSVASGTFTITTMTANGGTGGGAGSNSTNGAGGVGGAATGGNAVNSAGGNGSAGTYAGAGGANGSYYNTPLYCGTPYGNSPNSNFGGSGAPPQQGATVSNGGNGYNGIVSFYYQ